VLQHAGYVTAHFGKWHMGRVSPSQHGYDENDGANNNGGPDNVANPHPKQLELNHRLTDYLTAVDARMPKPNPAYDPGKPTQERRGGRRKEGT